MTRRVHGFVLHMPQEDLKPQPKFKVRSLVQLCPEDKARLFAYKASHGWAGEMPTGRLIIWAEPNWDPTAKEWVYGYEYGWDGTHEGSARESSLVPYQGR